MGIGTRIKGLRRRAGLTQPELAEKIGVHETTIRRWEQEKDRGPDGKAVTMLAEVLNTTPEYLLTETPNVNNMSDDTEAGHLVFKNGGLLVDLPDTPENKNLYWRIVSLSLTGEREPAQPVMV